MREEAARAKAQFQEAAATEESKPVDNVPNIDDIPMPSILSGQGPTSDNIPTSTSDLAAPEPFLSADETEQEADAQQADIPAADEPSDVATPVSEVPIMAEPEDFVSEQDQIPDFVGSPAEDGVADRAPEDEAVSVSDALPEPAAQEEESKPIQPEISPSNVGVPMPGSSNADRISMPLTQLPEIEEKPSVFDSVQIMKPAEQEDIVTRLGPGVGEPAPYIPPVAVPAAESAPVATGSQTGSKLGTNDSGGHTSKLKPLMEGALLNGRYEIVRKIGGGGMGAVYLASDNNLGGVLRAVKEMVQTHIEDEQQEKAVNDFKRESMILSTLDHPAIPTIFDYFYDEEECRFYLVMKYISGGDLSNRLRSAPEGRIDEKTVVDWAIQIIDVLDYLHNQPTTIVYRDLKPSNIMIDGNTGRIMLIDFGIARSIGKKEEKGVTAVGTMGYAPPELFSGNVEPRSDIYSLGSTMFHLLTGADPQSNPLLIFDFQKNPRPRQINSQLSDQIERILMRAVEYNADARFANAAEMRAVLKEHQANLQSGRITFGVTAAPKAVSLENQNVFCGFCGQRIVATDLFCAFCGAKQPLAQHGVHSEIYAKAALTAKLIVEGTSELNAPAFSLLEGREPCRATRPDVEHFSRGRSLEI